MISIVVPVYNEEESLRHFFTALMEVLPALSKEYEVVFVDDGSVDASLAILKALHAKHAFVRVFSFRRNMGKSEALTFGFQKAKGDIVVTMDADLQDKPSEIEKLLTRYKEGFEVVSGWRKDRQDKKKMVVISRLFNGILQKLFDLDLHDYNCGLKLYTRDAARSLRLYGGLHRFIPILAYQQGFTVAEVPVVHETRKYGKSKYGFSKLWRDLPDMFTIIFLAKYSKQPLHFFGIIGGLFTLIGSLILSYLTVEHFLGFAINRRPILFFGILLVIAGLQLFFTGFLADLMIHISHTPQSFDEKNLHFPVKYASDK